MSLFLYLGHFKGLLYNEVVITDDGIFRLHYKIATYLLFFVSLLATGTMYLGHPIYCTLARKDWDYMIQKPMLDIFCFIHSTFIVPNTGAVSVRDQLYPYPGVGHVGKASGMIIINGCR